MLRHRLPWQKPMRGAMLNTSHELARELAFCLIFNEMGTVESLFDHVHGFNSVLSGGTPYWVNTERGPAIHLTNTHDTTGKIDTGVANGKIPPGADVISVEVWLEVVAATGASMWPSFARRAGVNYTLWDFSQNQNSTNLVAGFGTINGYNTFYPTGGLGWHHLLLTYDGVDKAILYKDGVHNETKDPVTNTGVLDTPHGTWGQVGVGGNTAANGRVGLLRYWNRVLTADEVAWLYREPYAMFYPQNHARLVDPGIEDYYDDDNRVSFRVYQEAS